MSFFLLDNRNRNARGGFHGHASRNSPVTAIVIHTTENDPTSNTARNVASWMSTTRTQVSYHTIVDSANTVRLLPWTHTAFHVRGFNSASLGLSFGTRAHLWGRNPTWDDAALRRGAAELRAMADRYGIPLRRITAAQARAGTKGIVSHAQMDPSRRSDPGNNFPWTRFLALAAGTSTGPRNLQLTRPNLTGPDVREWQDKLNEWRRLRPGGDDNVLSEETLGTYGPATDRLSRSFMRLEMGVPDGRVVGPRTRQAMEDALAHWRARARRTGERAPAPA